MGLRNSINKLAIGNTEATKMLSKEFNNIEDQIIRVQKNQIEFEKYLLQIIKNQNENKNKN